MNASTSVIFCWHDTVTKLSLACTLPASVVVDVETANFTFDFGINILDIHRGTQVFQLSDDTDLWQEDTQINVMIMKSNTVNTL